jgi:predicted nucleic acid-binding Zn ribbon protein
VALLPLNDAAYGALRVLLRETSISPGKVCFAWTAIVGPAIERATTVRLEGDTLIVETTSAQWAREVSRSTPVILRRLKGYLGDDVVRGMSVRSV